MTKNLEKNSLDINTWLSLWSSTTTESGVLGVQTRIDAVAAGLLVFDGPKPLPPLLLP